VKAASVHLDVKTGYPETPSTNWQMDEMPTSMEVICQEKTRVLGRAQESARSDDRDSFLRTSASRRVVPASHAEPDIHLLSRMILKATGKKGVPQGGVISPLLRNLYLNEVDRMLEKADPRLHRRGQNQQPLSRSL
jgi:hypothetical protein